MIHVASGMRNLGQDIVNTHHTRTKELNDLSGEVNDMFKEFATEGKARTDFINHEIKQFVNDLRQAEVEHSKERADFVNDLKQATHDLKKEVKNNIHEIRDHLQEIKEHVKELFGETRAEMAETRADMAEAKKAWVSACNKSSIGLKGMSPQPKKAPPKMTDKEMGPPHQSVQESKPKGGSHTKKADS